MERSKNTGLNRGRKKRDVHNLISFIFSNFNISFDITVIQLIEIFHKTILNICLSKIDSIYIFSLFYLNIVYNYVKNTYYN